MPHAVPVESLVTQLRVLVPATSTDAHVTVDYVAASSHKTVLRSHQQRRHLRVVALLRVSHPALLRDVAQAPLSSPARALYMFEGIVEGLQRHGVAATGCAMQRPSVACDSESSGNTNVRVDAATWTVRVHRNCKARVTTAASFAHVDLILWYSPAHASRRVHTIVAALPPLPCTGPDIAWSRRLVRLENAFVRLATANAYVSTLGGGHFLCRHLTTAVRLARAQIAIAAALGDGRLCARASVHLVYCAVQAGLFRSAMRLVRRLERRATLLGDDATLLQMCAAARRYTVRTHDLWAAGQLAATAPAHQGHSATDEYYRQRFVAP